MITYEHRALGPGGKIVWQEWTDRALFDVQDNIYEYQSIGQDITTRKRAEEEQKKLQVQLTNAVEMAHLGHWECDVPNNIFTFNDNFYKIFRTTADEVGGYSMTADEYAKRFLHPDDLNLVGEEMGLQQINLEITVCLNSPKRKLIKHGCCLSRAFWSLLP